MRVYKFLGMMSLLRSITGQLQWFLIILSAYYLVTGVIKYHKNLSEAEYENLAGEKNVQSAICNPRRVCTFLNYYFLSLV